MTALNPVFTVKRQLSEGLQVHKGMSRRGARTALDPMHGAHSRTGKRLDQYPHELSGGMRARGYCHGACL